LPRMHSPVAQLPRTRVRASRPSSTNRGDHRSRRLTFADVAPLFGFSSSRRCRPRRALTPLRRMGSAPGLVPGVSAVALPLRRSPRG
jgi:hypothetical protein